MKRLIFLLVTVFYFMAYGQDKYNYFHFNKLMELKGTDFVIASIENVGKKFTTKSKYLLFINTKNGQSKKVDFPKDSFLQKIEQINIDNLGINKLIVTAKTINLNNSKSIDWEDPTQILILSIDGQEMTQLTEDDFFVRTWMTSSQTGTIVITGHYDTNNNGKYDETDKNEILIYDLKTLKLISKI